MLRPLELSLLLVLPGLLGCSSDDSGTPAAGGSGGSAAAAGMAGVGNAAGSSGASGAGGSAGSAGSAGTPEVSFVGRVDKVAADDVRMSWSGSSIQFRFSGTDASITLDDDGRYFSVFVDGVKQPVLETSSGEQSYPVAQGLSPGEHEVRVFRRTEGSFGPTRFIGLDLPGGTLLPPPTPAPRRIEIIGDSITCGYGNEGPDENCNFSAETENHTLSYGAIAARNLGADLVTVAWSGKGVIFNYGDDKTEPLPEVYDRVIAGDASSVWDFSWQPHVVVVNLGTNDYSTDGDPSESEFALAYEAFLTHLRDKYPQAFLLCLVPTGLLGNDRDQAQTAMLTAVSARASQGDTSLAMHSLTFQSTGWGCDYHPSLATHASMAEALTQELKSRLGW